MGWLWHLAGRHTSVEGWVIVAVLAVLLVGLSVSVVLLWPRSRRWAAENRLHRLATRNEGSIRRDSRDQLDDALRTLSVARRDCLVGGHEDDAKQISLLIHQIETVRDRVSSDYIPSSVNARNRRREENLDRLLASEAVAQHCKAIARETHDGGRLPTGLLGQAHQAVDEVNDRGLVSS